MLRPVPVRVRQAAVSVLLAIVLGPACGSSGSSTPTKATPTVVSVQISGNSSLIVGQGRTFTATAALSDGTSRAVSGTWGTDAPMVVSITSGGQVTALSPGAATIWIDAENRRTTLLLMVRIEYTGTWQGNYKITSCTEDPAWAAIGFCQTFQTSTPQVTVFLTQSGTAVAGTIFFGGIGATANGTVDGGNVLRLNASTTQGTITVTLADWVSTLQSTGMEGSFTLNWFDASDNSSASFSGTLMSLFLVSGANANVQAVGHGGEDRRSLLERALVRLPR